MDLDEFDDFGDEEEQEEEQLDPNNPDHAFILLEREFTKTIADIEQNAQAAQYAEEFNKLFEALYTHNETRKQLTQRCAELEEQLAGGTEKLIIATKIAEGDAEVIASLKGKIEYSWRMTDAAHEREQQAQEIIDNLRSQISALVAELDFKNKMSSEDDGGGQQSKNQESLEREKEKLMGEIGQLQVKLANAIGYQEELERKNSHADLKIIDLSSQLQDLANDFDKTKKQRDKLEGEAVELNNELSRCNGEVRSLQSTVQKGETFINRLERQIDDLKNLKEKLSSDLENLTDKYENLQDVHKQLKNTQDDTKKQLGKAMMENKLKDDQAVKMRSEINKFVTIREQYDKKIVKLECDKRAAWDERDALRQIQISTQKEIQQYKRQSDVDKRTMDSMVKEKDLLNKNILKHQDLIKEHIKLFKIQEQTKKKLELEIGEQVQEIGKQRKQVSYLEKERDRLVDEGLELTQKIEDTMEEIKLKKTQIYDLKKSLAENDNKLRIQQNLFEGVRAERNNLQKALQESAAECGELKNKLKVSSHQSEQLKEDIAMKEQELIREENILRKITKDKENLRIELDNALEAVKQLKEEIVEMKTEEKRLHKVIFESDKRIKELTKDLDTLMNERDILGSQLVRRNDELALLYEKIRILQSTLQRGEAHYERRLEDIRLLKIEVKRLRQEKLLLTKSITNMTDLRQEIFHMERDLTRERLKCRALEEELQNPLNIHRWRKLEGSDPDVLDLLKKIQLLQKRLLNQTSEAVERERQLKEAEKLYTNLKQIMAKQPSPTIQEDLNKTRKALTLRGNKLKCLVSELNMTELQSIEYKEDLDKVREELKEVKKKYLIEKKAHQKDLDALKTLESKHNQMPNIVPIKFTGGGFKMSVTTNEQF
ncbi:cilia- and flagella-associated protein 58-like [Photinus pyralis]|nr:cilia- and flagella-associated protein 58-like [Photinus pyralis]